MKNLLSLFQPPRAQRAADAFLNYLFEVDPQIDSNFGAQLRQQRPQLVAAWDEILANASDAARLRLLLRSLVQGFRAQGARPLQLAIFGSAILRVLRGFSRRQCVESWEHSWVKVYGEILRELQGGVNLARTVRISTTGSIRNV